MEADVLEMPVPELDEQLVFDGWPKPSRVYFKLASASKIPTDAELYRHQHVSGRFEGTVSGRLDHDEAGGPARVWIVTVLEATIDGEWS